MADQVNLQLLDLPGTALQQLLLSVPPPIAFMLASTCRRFHEELQHNKKVQQVDSLNMLHFGFMVMVTPEWKVLSSPANRCLQAILHKMLRLPALHPETTSMPLDKPNWVEQLVALRWTIKAGTMLLTMLTNKIFAPEEVWEQVLKGAEPDFIRMCQELRYHMQSALVPYGTVPPLLVWLLVLQLQGIKAGSFDLGASGSEAQMHFAPAAARLQQLASQIYFNTKVLVKVEFESSQIDSFWPLLARRV